MTTTVAPVYGPTNPAPEQQAATEVQRFGSVVGLNEEREARYRELHADVWPSVIKQIRHSNIRNYSIYVTELAGVKYLFSYFEYVGDDFESDMRRMANDPATQRWWNECVPCQTRLPSAAPGEQWSEMEMLFLMEQ